MKTTMVLALAAMTGVSVSDATGQCDDPYDNVLCAYDITGAESGFARDNAVSAFWQGWSGRDQLDMVSPDNCYPDRCSFIGSDDASVTIKAACTGTGLYLLCTVNDNTWVDRASAEDWGADAIDIYFDAMDANAIWNCGSTCLIGLYESKLTYTTQQFQVWMGASQPPAGCRYAYYDDALWSWQTVPRTWDELAQNEGILVDYINLSATAKAQEWFIPWTAYGKGLDPGVSLNNLRVAMSGGYNDKDGDNTEPDCLRWLKKDPWSGDLNYWADVLLPAGMSVQRPGVVRDGSARARGTETVGFFNLKGERVSGGTHAGSGMMVIGVTDGGKAGWAQVRGVTGW